MHFLLVHFDKDLSHRDHGLIIHLASGHLGAQLNPSAFQQKARTFLDEFDRIYPGAKQQVRYDDRRHILGHLEQWTSNPFTKGSYLCYRPGQLTRFAELEGQPIHNLLFAGEHTNSFYEWQGFLEGAALSGLAAARHILVSGRLPGTSPRANLREID